MNDALWHIGLDGWVLQDGNYPDLHVGDRVDFALVYDSEDLRTLPDSSTLSRPSATESGADRYSTTGVLQQLRTISVLDLGDVAAYSDSVLPGRERSRLRRWRSRLRPPPEWVAGTVRLSVDPFFYMDDYAKDVANPPLIYSWEIVSIARATGPEITVVPGDPRYVGPDEGPFRMLDPARMEWRPLECTSMWDDEPDGSASYLLGCRLVESGARRERFHLGPDDPTTAIRHLTAWWPHRHAPVLRDALVAAYADPARGYHDLTHLGEVLERLAQLGCDDEAVVLAAWFHDAVYDRAGDDEERSAVWAEQALADDPPLAAEVGRLVRLTARHRPQPGDRPGQLLCDADLAILAAGPERYAAYVAGVREEYAAVAEPDFRAGRRAVLIDLLAKEHLFETPEARGLWERAARANLKAEVVGLS